jgi:hypothetical protein
VNSCQREAHNNMCCALHCTWCITSQLLSWCWLCSTAAERKRAGGRMVCACAVMIKQQKHRAWCCKNCPGCTAEGATGLAAHRDKPHGAE